MPADIIQLGLPHVPPLTLEQELWQTRKAYLKVLSAYLSSEASDADAQAEVAGTIGAVNGLFAILRGDHG